MDTYGFRLPAEVTDTGPCGCPPDGRSLICPYTGCTGVWHNLLSFFFLSVIADSALEDFVLMHCVFIPNSQLCPVLMAQYPFSTICYVIRFNVPSHPSEAGLKKALPYSDSAVIVLIFNGCAPTTLRPRRAPTRRSWTTRWTTSAGWSAWWCSGLLCMEITCKRRRSRWPSSRSVNSYNITTVVISIEQ